MKARVARASLGVLLVICAASSGALSACGDDDDGPPPAPCPDEDGDGHGEASCDDDCDDSNAAIFEGNAEICDGYDNDCDLVIDDGDFAAAGSANVRDVSEGSVVTWSAEGSGSYRVGTVGSPTYVFALEADGTLSPARMVTAAANLGCPAGETGCAGSGWASLPTETALPTPGCLTRGGDWLAAPSCVADTECPQPACLGALTRDGGAPVLGRCAAVDGGFETRCMFDSDCAWACASERCVPPARDDVRVVSDCHLADLVTASVGGDGAFAVGVETAGCTDGRLRAGWLGIDGTLSLFGPEARSNIWLGIDLGQFGTRVCGGASRASGIPGAAMPAVAALVGPASETQALVVYLGGSRLRDGCGSAESVPVEVIGLSRESGAGSIRDWLAGTNDGKPQPLGETNGGGPPSVVSVRELGWVVGYPQAAPDTATPVALHFVERPEVGAMFTSRLPDGLPWPAHRRRETEPLTLGAPFVSLPAGSADYVQVAVGAVRGRIYDLGVTWIEDCADTRIESVWFSLVRFDPRSPSTATATTPTRISTPTRGGFPTIVYAGTESPFVTEGWSRVAGGTPVASDERGGFVVAWAGKGPMSPSNGVFAVRVSEADGLPIDERPFSLRPSGGPTSAASVTLYATPSAASGSVSFGYWDQETQVGGGRLICPAR